MIMSNTDILLTAISVVIFYIIQTIFFTQIGSKSNLGVTNEVISSIRDMVLNLTYNKIDINDYIGLTDEEKSKLSDIKKVRNVYNKKIMTKIYRIIIGLLVFICGFLFTAKDHRGLPLRQTFFSTTNIILIIITILTYGSEFYLYKRFIGRMQLITALDFLEDPNLFEKNLTKYYNNSLYDIYNDNEIQIINEINKYIAPFRKQFMDEEYVKSVLIELDNTIELDSELQELLKNKAKVSTQIDNIDANDKLLKNNNKEPFNSMKRKLEKIKKYYTKNINIIINKKINEIALKKSVNIFN